MVLTALEALEYSEQGSRFTVSDQSNLGNASREKTQDGMRTENQEEKCAELNSKSLGETQWNRTTPSYT